jgi:TRAP-type C4-dicarboxylate transport system substrate-binding protein
MIQAFGRLALALSLAAASLSATAQQKFDVSVPWNATEFHSLNAQKFADRVKQVTNGEVLLTIHTGSALGVKANDSLRALADGVVPFAEYAMFQNTSRAPILGLETLPFLVSNHDQLKVMHGIARPVWEGVLAKNNQKALYMVPWPSQNFFVNKPITSIDSFKGMKMRSFDKLTSDWINRLGMTPVQLNNQDIVPALGSGMLDGVPTSATTAAAQKFGDFLKFGYNTNHLWASNVMAVNLETWNKLKPEHRAAIEKAARDLEPEFWEVSKAEHTKRVAELKEKGLNLVPAPAALVDEMRKRTKPLQDEYAKPMGPEAIKILADFRAKTGQ